LIELLLHIWEQEIGYSKDRAATLILGLAHVCVVPLEALDNVYFNQALVSLGDFWAICEDHPMRLIASLLYSLPKVILSLLALGLRL
jgi:hypothetical protein